MFQSRMLSPQNRKKLTMMLYYLHTQEILRAIFNPTNQAMLKFTLILSFAIFLVLPAHTLRLTLSFGLGLSFSIMLQTVLLKADQFSKLHQ